MKFEVSKQRTDFWTEEYEVRLPEKTKKRLRIVAVISGLLAVVSIPFAFEKFDSKPKTEPIESPLD